MAVQSSQNRTILHRYACKAVLLLFTPFFAVCSNEESSFRPENSVHSSKITQAEVAFPAGSTVKVCVINWFPFAYKKGEVLTGVTVDLAKDIIVRLGYPVEFHLEPALRCVSEVRNRHLTLIPVLSQRSLDNARGQLIAINPSVQRYLPALFVHQDHPLAELENVESLAGWRVGALRGSSFIRRYKGRVDISWTLVNQTDALLKVLLSDRVDVVLGDYHSQELLRQDESLGDYRSLAPFYSEPIYWAVHKDNHVLAKQIGEQLTQALQDGTVDTYYRKHVGASFREIGEMVDSNQFVPLPVISE